MHWQRALELPILHETQSLDSSHAAELVSCWRGWPDASGTSPSDAPLEPLRGSLSERTSRDASRVGSGMWETLEGPGRKRGEKWLPFFPPRALRGGGYLVRCAERGYAARRVLALCPRLCPRWRPVAAGWTSWSMYVQALADCTLSITLSSIHRDQLWAPGCAWALGGSNC